MSSDTALPPWLQAPVAAVLRDLQQPTEVPIRLAYDTGTLWVAEVGDTAGTGVDVGRERGASLLVVLADQLQEQFVPETQVAWGEPRPLCPGHPHPAQARLKGGEAVWICPDGEAVLAPIGQLAPRAA
jgi:hypothetical protein